MRERAVIREATEADLPAVVAMGERFHAASGYGVLGDYDPSDTENNMRLLFKIGLILVAESNGRLVGALCMVFAPLMFNSKRFTANEMAWWVDEDARDTGAGVDLLRALEPACRARGAVGIQMLHLKNSPPQAAALYERLGFVQSESSYLKVL